MFALKGITDWAQNIGHGSGSEKVEVKQEVYIPTKTYPQFNLLPAIGALPKRMSAIFDRLVYGDQGQVLTQGASEEPRVLGILRNCPQPQQKSSDTSVVSWADAAPSKSDNTLDVTRKSEDAFGDVLASKSDSFISTRSMPNNWSKYKKGPFLFFKSFVKKSDVTRKSEDAFDDVSKSDSFKSTRSMPMNWFFKSFVRKSIQQRRKSSLLEDMEKERMRVLLELLKAEDKIKALNAAVKRTLRGFVDRGKTDNRLTLTNFCKCLDMCNLKKFVSPLRASVWVAHQDENRKISVEYIVYILIEEMAKDIVWWKDGASGEGVHYNDPRVKRNRLAILQNIADRAGVPIHEQKFDPIGSRLMVEGKLLGRTRARLDRLDECLDERVELEDEQRFRRELIISNKPGRGRISDDGEGGASTSTRQLDDDTQGGCMCAGSLATRASCRRCKRDQNFGKKTGNFEFMPWGFNHNIHLKVLRRPATLKTGDPEVVTKGEILANQRLEELNFMDYSYDDEKYKDS